MMRCAGFFLLGSLLAAGAFAATPEPGPDAVAAYAASIPERPYYPAGYRDLRIAAAAQAATFPRDPVNVVMEGYGGEPSTYDLIDCNAESFDPEGEGGETARLSDLALFMARVGGELRQLGYRSEIFEQPLAEHERETLTAHPARAAEQSDEEMEAAYGVLTRLAEDMDARRARLQPGKPKIVTEGGCGAGEAEFVIRTAPANGKVWIVNAFAFHVCMTKVRDPWDLRACRWTEVDPDNATMASGRYMYQARWPDGKVARGARVFEGDFESDAPATITIRRN